MKEVTYTVQVKNGYGTWHDVHIDPHHQTLDDARAKVHRGKMRNPRSEYRIMSVTKEVVE